MDCITDMHWCHPQIRIRRDAPILTAVLARCGVDDLPGVRIVLGNLARYTAVYRTRKRNHWYEYGLHSAYGITYDQWITCLDTLTRAGVIQQVDGYRYSESNRANGYMERGAWLTDALGTVDPGELYAMTYLVHVPAPTNEVRVKAGRPTSYELLQDCRERLSSINDVCMAASWSLDPGALDLWTHIPHRESWTVQCRIASNTRDSTQQATSKHKGTGPVFAAFSPYMRIFDDAGMRTHGRFYAGLWSHMPRAVRAHIRIDGEETIEADYGSTHLRLLYAERGLDLPGDLYTLPPLRGHQIPRKAWKSVATTCIGARSAREASASLRAKIDLGRTDPQHRDAIVVPGGITPADLRSHFTRAHAPVADRLCSGQTVRLMGIESRIAERVLMALTSEDIPCLALHDSFRVAMRHEAKLMEAMRDAWRAEVGGEPAISVSRREASGEPQEAPDTSEATQPATPAIERLVSRTRARRRRSRAEIEAERRDLMQRQEEHRASLISMSEALSMIESELAV